MVCSKLDKGKCKTIEKICNKKYKVKMVDFKNCSNFGKVMDKSKAPTKKK